MKTWFTPLIALMTLIVLAACATPSSLSNGPLSDDEARTIMPTRKLRTLVVLEDQSESEKVRHALDETSRVLRGQIGVELELHFEQRTFAWKTSGRSQMLTELYHFTRPREASFDIVIGFAQMNGLSALGCSLLGCWLGLADDTYRRYIIMRNRHPWFIAHEVGHTLVLRTGHSDSGLMQPTVLGLIPGAYIISPNDYLFSPDDRSEALRNKWRTFGERVQVPDPEDVIFGN